MSDLVTCPVRVEVRDKDPETGTSAVFRLDAGKWNLGALPAQDDRISFAEKGRFASVVVKSRVFAVDVNEVGLVCVYYTLTPSQIANELVSELGWKLL